MGIHVDQLLSQNHPNPTFLSRCGLDYKKTDNSANIPAPLTKICKCTHLYSNGNGALFNPHNHLNILVLNHQLLFHILVETLQ